MELWHIRGGKPLNGVVQVQGSKNASLPILAASVLAPLRCELHNVPQLRDVSAALRILSRLGCVTQQQGNDVYIDSTRLSCSYIPHSLMEEMRSSVIFMGALLARCGEVRLSLPGGCQLGKRPIDLHLAALRKLGAAVTEDGDEIVCRQIKMQGTEIVFPFPSVGATENAMLAACAARGETVIRGAAKEPEIMALQDFLRAVGADITGAGTETVCIRGFHPRRCAKERILPDRIAAATYACAVAACGGEALIRGIDPKHFSAVLHFLKEAGCDIMSDKNSVKICRRGKLRATGEIATEPYPGFPTDAQPLIMAALLRAEGTSRIRETIFENRFRHVPELRRLGADISVEGQTASIRGAEKLKGTALCATDLRGGAAMILAGLSAEGETLVCDDGHVLRGYESFDRRLRSLGADVRLEC